MTFIMFHQLMNGVPANPSSQFMRNSTATTAKTTLSTFPKGSGNAM